MPLKPFLIRTRPLRGESLESLLVRLSVLNVYPSPTTARNLILAELKRQQIRDRLACPHHRETLQIAGMLADLPFPALQACTPQRWTPRGAKLSQNDKAASRLQEACPLRLRPFNQLMYGRIM